jgi:peptide/nickel transport system substrate-binding protein
VLDVCLVGEPDTLYLYGGSRSPATRHVMEALYDGPIDHVDYVYRPAILEKIPSLADGDALTLTVRVREGDPIVDATGEVIELAEGVRFRPAGCRAEDCTVEFEGGVVSMERMYVTFVLREGITWADGEPLTADDSVFAFEVASGPATPAWHELVERTASYRALDDRRTKWIGLPGYVGPTYSAHFFPPLPRHELHGLAAEELLLAEETRRAPLGWGPFVVEEWVAGDSVALHRSPHYFRAAEGLPVLDRVVFRFTSGVSEMVARLLSGECDVGIGGDYDAIGPLMPVLVQAETEGLLSVISTAGTAWEQLELGIVPDPGYERPDYFGDARVRRGIAHCIDRQAIADEITYGHGVVLESYLPPGHPLYARELLAHRGYDPVAGQSLLDEAGWLDADGDGVREASRVQGVLADTRFEVTVLLPQGDEVLEQTLRIVKANLADCGVRVELERLPAQDLFADGPEGPYFGRRFDLIETTQRLGLVPACERYVSSEVWTEEGWYDHNVSGFADADYDVACRGALRALPGTAAYDEYHRRAQAVFSAEVPAIPLFVWPRVILARPGVSNLAPGSTASSTLWNLESIDVDEE